MGIFPMRSRFSLLCYIAITAVSWLPPFASSASVYMLSKLTNPGLSAQFTVSDQSACFDRCRDNISGASYSDFSKVCMVSYCGNLMVSYNALWTTILCINAVNTCAFPRPIYEWMMTDSCGFSNTGSIDTGLLMVPSSYTGSSATPLTVTYTPSPSAIFGNSVLYQNVPNQFSFSASSANILINIQSFTIAAYFWLSEATSNDFLLFGFFKLGVSDATGPVLWIVASGSNMFYNLKGYSGVSFYSNYQPPQRSWTHVALVYDTQNQVIKLYLNGTQVKELTSLLATSTQLDGTNVFMGARAGRGQLPGTVYCAKFFTAALTQPQIAAVSSSCINGKVDLFV